MKKFFIHFLLLLITPVVLGQNVIPLAPEATLNSYLKKEFDCEGNVLPYRAAATTRNNLCMVQGCSSLRKTKKSIQPSLTTAT